MYKILKIFTMCIFLLLSLPAFAASLSNHYLIIAPNCLIENFKIGHKVLYSAEDLTLLETNKTGLEKLLEKKHSLKGTACGGFIDITDSWNKAEYKNLTTKSKARFFLQDNLAKKSDPKLLDLKIQYQNQVHDLISAINPQAMWLRLTALSAIPDRYSNSDTGVATAIEIKSEIEDLADYHNRDDISVYLVASGTRYRQNSVVVKIGDSNLPAIVVGAHMDTLMTNKPGADDDGTGSVTLIEAAKILLNSGIRFQRPIYLIWYGAEEVGLVGSQFVVQDFINKNIPVFSVMQLDMTGYANQNDLTMWLLNDYVNLELTNYIKVLIDTYVGRPVKFTSCGYACSDHVSWTRKGFNACMPFEAQNGKHNPYIHTANDTMDKVSLTHMTDFAKLAIAYITELAEPMIHPYNN